MSIENKLANTSETTEEPVVSDVSTEKPIKVEPRFERSIEPKDKSIKTLLKSNFEKSKQEEDAPLPMTSKERRAVKEKIEPVTAPEKSPPAIKAAEDQPSKESKTEESVPPTPQQATGIPAPAALTKEEKELWATLPEQMQKAFIRREEDTQKGIDKLKAQYKPIEDALAPIRPMLQQRGLTEAHAVKQLFDWHAALSSSHKGAQINAFRALAQSHGVDINLLAPQQQQIPVAQQPPAQSNQQSQDPLAQIQPYLEQTIQPIRQQLSAYEAQLQKQELNNANKELATFSADKPHFEKVRYRMAEILHTASEFGRPVSLQEAYDEAVWGMTELRSQMMQEQEAKRQAEFQAQQEALSKKIQDEYLLKQKKEEEELAKRREQDALEKARRASVSPRSTTPVGSLSSKGPKKPQSVADTLRASMKELSATI